MVRFLKLKQNKMKTFLEKVLLATNGQIEFVNITEKIEETLEKSGIKNGQVLVFSPHTTAAIVINHEEPMLLKDITRMLYRLAPIDDRYDHDLFEITKNNLSDGRSNGHSHCKNVLLNRSETLIVQKGKVILGPKQDVFFVELDGGRKRDFLIQITGE